MCGGLVGYLGYDMVRLMERLPDKNPDPLGLPEAWLVRPTIFAIFDTVRDALTLAAPVHPRDGVSRQRRRGPRRTSGSRRPGPRWRDRSRHRRPRLSSPRYRSRSSNLGRDGYMAAVERAKEYIRAGDVFQVVPSQRFSVPFALHPFALYRALRRTNPAPFLFYLDFGEFAVVGSSPEVMVRLRDGEVTIRPLAGTRRRVPRMSRTRRWRPSCWPTRKNARNT